MSDQQTTVIVKDLYKSFKLPHEKHSGMKQAFVGLFRGKRGYETQKVLSDISFEIKKGEFFGIVGRNGSGKSTLLKLLAGIYTPDKGLIQVNGPLTPFIELGVGFNPELTGRENVFMNGALLGFDTHEIEAMYEGIVEFAEIEAFMDQKLKNYSSGMQVRLAFSIAIRANTPILLIDEVLAVGDSEFQGKCYAEFRKMKESGKTIIFVTHDMSAVERFCDRALVLSKGRVVGVFSPREAAAHYEEMNAHSQKKSEGGGTNRWGSQEIEIDNVTLLDDKKKEMNNPVQGQELSIKITLRQKQKQAERVKVGLAIYDNFGVNISGPNSGDKRFNSNEEIIFTIPKLPLVAGVYSLTVAVVGETDEIVYDHIKDLLTFSVIGSEDAQQGKVSLFGQWE